MSTFGVGIYLPSLLYLFQSLIHISTAYSNCHLPRIEERFYDYPVSYNELENMLEKLDEKIVDQLTPK